MVEVTDTAPKVQGYGRIEAVDLARGIALVAMTLFHFGWDLEMFGFAERGFASQPAMVWFARCIASSFLFLVGVSLVLAHAKEFKLNGFLKRLLMIVAAAALITIATWFATPDIFIFFGILHHIALASVLGLLFLRLPWGLTAVAAVLVFFAALYARTDFFNAPLWWWSGLNSFTPRSSDYVPIFPFFAAVLAGMSATQFCVSRGYERWFARFRFQSGVSRALKFIGRHSLIYYLLHQPVMISILAAIQWIMMRS